MGNNIKFSEAVAANYNKYVASGNLTGNPATSYSSMVPFEMGTADYAMLEGTAADTGGQTAGPGISSNVMCLSCHRAHASGWDHAMRWNTKSEFLVFNGEYPGGSKSRVCRHGSLKGAHARKREKPSATGRRRPTPPTSAPSATSATRRIDALTWLFTHSNW